MKSPVFLIGGGPSAKAHDLSRLYGRGTVIVVNDGFRLLPRADICFTADGSWFNRRRAELAFFPGLVAAALPSEFYARANPRFRFRRLIRRPGVGIAGHPNEAWFADNSGFAALSWVCAHRPAAVALIGYDLNPGGGHWHAGYEWTSRIGPDRYPSWAGAFDFVAPHIEALGVDVVNANPDSMIRGFRHAPFDAIVSGAAWED